MEKMERLILEDRKVLVLGFFCCVLNFGSADVI